MAHTEKKLNSTQIFKGKILELIVYDVEIEDGTLSKREVVLSKDGVGVLAINEDDEIYMVKQFRYPLQKEIYEIPAGRVEENEDPKDCGIRELEEEVGLIADNFEYLGKGYSSPGCYNEAVHLYLATNLHDVGQKLDAGEFLDIIKMPFEKALKMVKNDEIIDSKTQLAILKYNSYRK